MRLRPDRKQQRQREAQERLSNWQSLSTEEQLAELKKTPGASQKQTIRLRRILLGTQDVEVKPLKNKIIRLDPELLDSGEVMAGSDLRVNK